MATLTALAQPAETSTPTATPTLEQALPPTEASNACFNIIQPQSGATLPKQGQVLFEWSEQVGAQYYILTFVNENGSKAVIVTLGTSLNQYIEVFPNGGQYDWFVTAYDVNAEEICSTSSASFSKPIGDPTPKPTLEPEPEPTSTEKPYCDPCDSNPYSGCYDAYYYYTYCGSG